MESCENQMDCQRTWYKNQDAYNFEYSIMRDLFKAYDLEVF